MALLVTIEAVIILLQYLLAMTVGNGMAKMAFGIATMANMAFGMTTMANMAFATPYN